jgi:peptidoglycan/xylan/chitin deacetylase (PgdA/CDA1 family)
MSVATLQKFKQRGDEIGSHTLGHCDQTKLSAKELAKNAEDSKRNLEADHLGPVTSFAYPYGSYDVQTQTTVAKTYPLIRTSDQGYNDRYFDNQNIRSIAVTSSTSDQEFQAWLTYAKANKLWLVIVYHHIDETGAYSVTSANLKRQLQMIRDSQLQVLPLSEAARAVRPDAL